MRYTRALCQETFYFAGVNDEDHVWDRDAGLSDVGASAWHKGDIIRIKSSKMCISKLISINKSSFNGFSQLLRMHEPLLWYNNLSYNDVCSEHNRP